MGKLFVGGDAAGILSLRLALDPSECQFYTASAGSGEPVIGGEQALRGERARKRHVQRCRLEASGGQDLLAVEVAERPGTASLDTQLREESVVVTAALAQPVALFVHAKARHQDEPERCEVRKVPALADRLPERCPRTLRQLDTRLPVSPAQLVLRLTNRHDDVVPRRAKVQQQLRGARFRRC